jgi:glucokinase
MTASAHEPARSKGTASEESVRKYPSNAEGDGDGHMLRSALLNAPARNARPEYMRELNFLIVLEAFRTGSVMSRADVARCTKISAPTVSRIVERLVNARLLIEEGPGESTGGKRPVLLRFNEDYGRVLGVDLGGSHLRLAVASLDGTILEQTHESIDRTAGPVAILKQIAERGKALLASHGTVVPVAVSVATPGVVDVDAGLVVAARNLLGWKQVPVRTVLEGAFGAPVGIENDVNAAAIGERWRGRGRGCADLVFVSIGTGIGAGVMIRGEIHRGVHFAAGEINSVPSGVLDADGNEAWLEDAASGPAIAARAAHLGLAVTSGELTVAKVFELAAAGDPVATGVVQDTARALARGVVALLAALDPAVVVFGGGVSHGGDVLLAPLREEVGRLTRLRCELVLSELGAGAQLHGAVYSALRLADTALIALARAAGC